MTGDTMTHLTEEEAMTKVTVPTTMTHLTEEEAMTKVTGDTMTHLTEEEAMTKVTGDTMTHLTEEEAMTKVTGRHHDTPYRRRSHDQGDSPNHLSYYSDSPDQHDKRHHDTSYRRRSHDQGDSPDHLSYYSDSPDQHDKRHHDTLYRRRSHDQGDRRQLDTPDRSSQEDAESSFPLTKFQKRVLQLLLDIRKTVSDTSTCGGKPADTACTLTIKRNNSLEEVQNLEDELVNPSYFIISIITVMNHRTAEGCRKLLKNGKN
ncbi:hypothetical protein O3P69_005700 [Scylla paramamosain]|uniref:Uncharacterized protein n=1 Tax=Scylla paramamosain TaxID=85552 RepID=A0AAW0U6Q9_SCYPA